MESWIDNIVDEDFLKNNLTFSSLFVAIYENLTEYVVANIHDFLCNMYVEDGELKFEETANYKEQIRSRIVDNKGNKDNTKASFLWLVDNYAISQEEYDLFLDLKKTRNEFAHELLQVVLDGIPKEKVYQLAKMIELYKKISRWWFVNIEAAIACDEFSPEDISEAQCAINTILDMIINVIYNGKSEEYKNMVEKLKNNKK